MPCHPTRDMALINVAGYLWREALVEIGRSDTPVVRCGGGSAE
jgi:hypothetical protein